MKTQDLIIAGLLVAAGSATLLSGSNSTVNKIENTSVKTIKEKPVVSVEPEKTLTVQSVNHENLTANNMEKPGCIFKTTFEGEGLEKGFYYKIPGKVMASIDHGLDWLTDAQQKDGGWGAGSHGRQDVLDPHAVQSDPATTAMVAMAIQRSGSDLQQGKYSENLKDALMYLIDEVENSGENDLNITNLSNTQPQSKLGKNIDVVLTSQFLSNILHDLDYDQQLKRRVKRSIQKCVDKIEMGQSANGSQQGSGWAGVLQSSFASSALEAAQVSGVEVDEKALDKSRDFQKGNINTTTNDVVTESAAGVVLYSVSGSHRASAKETAAAKDAVMKAKREGKIKNEEVNVENLQKAGMSESQAMKYSTAYKINKTAKKLAQDDNVLSGYGNNGGEEFLSYL